MLIHSVRFYGGASSDFTGGLDEQGERRILKLPVFVTRCSLDFTDGTAPFLPGQQVPRRRRPAPAGATVRTRDREGQFLRATVPAPRRSRLQGPPALELEARGTEHLAELGCSGQNATPSGGSRAGMPPPLGVQAPGGPACAHSPPPYIWHSLLLWFRLPAKC